jgi:iron complex outermembrane recepter protein
MNKARILNNLLATTMICGALGMAAPAYAQNDEDPNQPAQAEPVEGSEDVSPNAQGEEPEGDEDIIITGSRIPQPNLESVSPVTVVNSQEVKLSGTTRVEDLINSLPQTFAGQGSNVSNGASGTATLNLRNLGSERTLVLVNGRRLVPGDPFSSAADVNFIPAALIDRVDVLTGGASSVYGADAVAGVVNFIMDTDFEGVRLDAQYSFFNHDNNADDTVINALRARGFGFPGGTVADGGAVDVTAVIGAGFDDGRGHVTAYAGYRKIDDVLQAKRDYSSCVLQARSDAQAATPTAQGLTLWQCGGSGTGAPANFFNGSFSFIGSAGPNRTLLPVNNIYNFGPINYYQRPDERYVFGAFANYEISNSLKPYMEVMFMDDRTVAQIAPSGNFFSTSTINCDNPLLGAALRTAVCTGANLVGFNAGGVNDPTTPNIDERATVFTDPLGNRFNRGGLYMGRRNVEGGGRQDDLQHTDFRIVAGMRGDLDDVWSYDAFYQFGQVNFADTYLNDFSVTRLGRSLDVVTGANGQPVCRSVLTGEDPNCVPYDVFTQGGVTPAALNYLQTPGFQRGFTKETVANASVTGNLGDYGVRFPWAEEGVGINLGVEYRKEALDLQTDVAFQTNDLAGQGAPTLPVSGNFDVKEAFVETRIPIVAESFLHELTLLAGYRYSDYSVADRSFSTDTYKVGAELAPIRDIRFRGAYNRAVRAPNIQELFAPQRVALNGSTDPCAGPAVGGLVNGNTAAQCARTGVTAAQFGNVPANPAEQYNGLIGGNPNLNPEVADTITAGFVFQPRFLPRFALTVDYFDIEIESAIQGIGQDTILSTCIATGDPTFCSLINRDALGSLWVTSNGFVRDLQQNIGSFSTEGVDVSASYSMELGGMGNLGLSFVGTWLDSLVTDNGVSEPYDCVGFYGNQCGVPTPEWRHQARLSFTTPDGIGMSLRWRYFGSVDQDTTSTNPSLSGVSQPGHRTLPSVSYFDLALTARIGDHYQFRLGANNILDRDPPLVGQQACPAGFCNGNTWAQVYDALGRYIYAGVTLDF